MSHQTLADNLRSFLPPQERENLGLLEEAPRPLNEEALRVILDYAKDKAYQGFGSVLLFLDGMYEEYGHAESPSRYYEASTVITMLRDPRLGFVVDEECTSEGTFVFLQWSDSHPLFSYGHAKVIEVDNPDVSSISYPL